MKKLLLTVLTVSLILMSAFGYSLRMDSMGRIDYAIFDFESAAERNPANLTKLDNAYFRLSLGMDNAGLTMTDKWDDIQTLQEYGTRENEYAYSNMPITVNAFYKMGSLTLGLKYDMPKETYTYDYLADYKNRDQEADYYTYQDESYELASAINDLCLGVGYQMGEIGLGLNFGQIKDVTTFSLSTIDREDRPWWGVPDDNSEEMEFEITADNTYYGLGAVYPTGKMVLELAYKMASWTAEGKTTKAVWNGVADDVNDHDNFPIISATLDGTDINLKGTYKYSDNIDLVVGLDMLSYEGEADIEFTTIPGWTVGDATLTDNNVIFGIGFHEDAFKFGLEMNYNMFTVEANGYTLYDPILLTTVKVMEMTGDMTMVVFKVGAEFQATDKLGLRMGAIKYAPLSATGGIKNLDTDGSVDSTQDITLEPANEGNIILASAGVEYKFNNQVTLEYGYIGGHYLYNQNTLTLLTDLGTYGGALGTQTGLFTPMSFTKHAFSIKYSF
ncbi:MAG: porin [bacterium]|nr:porin [bacterium]